MGYEDAPFTPTQLRFKLRARAFLVQNRYFGLAPPIFTPLRARLVLPLLRHDVTVYVAEFLPNGAHLTTTTGRGLRRVDDRVAFNHTKPD